MFIGLTGAGYCRIFCLPDNYEVFDTSLNDIKFNLNPVFSKELIKKLDSESLVARSLEGTEFIPGCVGLNNLKLTDYANCVIQLLSRSKPLRDFCLLENTKDGNHSTSITSSDQRVLVSLKFNELIKKVWNPKNFKGHVSPHEFLEAVSTASDKRFRCDDKNHKEAGFGGQADPIQFLAWLFNSMKLHRKVIEKTFQGELEIMTLTKDKEDETSAQFNQKPASYSMDKKSVKFFFLTLDLPNVPLFKEQQELGTLPQINLLTLMKKYDGITLSEEMQT